jgi:ankyrin repeat protein
MPDNSYDTPIHSAIRHFNANDGGDVTILIYLLSLDKVQVNKKDPFGRLLSHFTCQYINTLPIDVFKYLIETKGADMSLIDKNASSPIRYAFEQFNPLNGGDIAVLTYLLRQKSVNINKGRDGLTLLHRACQKINLLPLDIFKFLIETMGCDVNARSFSGDTPLHYALRDFKSRGGGGNINTLTYLLTQEGIDVTIKGRTGYSLLHVACQSINHLSLDVFKYLIETKGCDINVQDNHTCTPFFYAIFHFNQHGNDNDDDDDRVATILTYLFDQKNLNTHSHDFNGRTLLHFACFSGDRFVTFQRDTNRDCDKEEAQNGTLRSKIIEIVIQKYLQDVLDETTL